MVPEFFSVADKVGVQYTRLDIRLVAAVQEELVVDRQSEVVRRQNSLPGASSTR